jgi:hypothetical protein
MDFAFFRDLPGKAFLVAWIGRTAFPARQKETAAGGPLFLDGL